MTLDEALAASDETQALDFKREFDPSSGAAWCELVKDIVAMANSGGGIILIGVEDDGSPSAIAPLPGGALDPAAVDDKVCSYTGQHLSGLRVLAVEKAGQGVLALDVPASRMPLVFTSPGTSPTGDGRQRTAFGRGTVYFRHGAKSETGTVDDIRESFERELGNRREEWLGNIRRVVEAPAGAVVQVMPAEFGPPGDRSAVGVRLVHDPDAPAVPRWNPDDTHRYRQKELLSALKARLGAGSGVNSYDVQSVRRAHNVDENPNFCHRPRFGSRQYSDAFLDWMVDEFSRDSDFFGKARGRARSADAGA
jgi:Schlafen, AlbA_2